MATVSEKRGNRYIVNAFIIFLPVQMMYDSGKQSKDDTKLVLKDDTKLVLKDDAKLF